MCMLIYIVASGSKKKGLLKFNPHEPRHALSLVCLVIPLIESAAIKKKKKLVDLPICTVSLLLSAVFVNSEASISFSKPRENERCWDLVFWVWLSSTAC